MEFQLRGSVRARVKESLSVWRWLAFEKVLGKAESRLAFEKVWLMVMQLAGQKDSLSQNDNTTYFKLSDSFKSSR